jgi:hypothetical protein
MPVLVAQEGDDKYPLARVTGMKRQAEDSKSALNREAQARCFEVEYEVMDVDGASHSPEYTVRVHCGPHMAEGIGIGKKAAEQDAASAMLTTLRLQDLSGPKSAHKPQCAFKMTDKDLMEQWSYLLPFMDNRQLLALIRMALTTIEKNPGPSESVTLDGLTSAPSGGAMSASSSTLSYGEAQEMAGEMRKPAKINFPPHSSRRGGASARGRGTSREHNIICRNCQKPGHKASQCKAGGGKPKTKGKLVQEQMTKELSEARGNNDGLAAQNVALREENAVLQATAEAQTEILTKAEKLIGFFDGFDPSQINEQLMTMRIRWHSRQRRWWFWFCMVTMFVGVTFGVGLNFAAAATGWYTKTWVALNILHVVIVVGGCLAWIVRRFLFDSYAHTYRVTRLLNDRHQDLRADSIALGKLKHSDAVYAEVEYRGWSHWFMAARVRTLTISIEIFVQICTGNNLLLNATESVVYARLVQSANSLHSVNVSRYRSVSGQTVVQDTALVALGLWHQMKMLRDDLPFPAALA